MSLWTVTLIVGYALIIILNLIFSFTFTTVLNLFICFAIIMLPAGVILFVGKMLPKRWFNENNKLFKINPLKQKICDFTRVKTWKDKIPVGGRVAGFRLNEIKDPKNIEYLDRFIYESCFAQWLHGSICCYSALACFIVLAINKNLVLPMALPIAVLFVYQNLTSTIIQWYVRPRVVRLKESVSKHNNK